MKKTAGIVLAFCLTALSSGTAWTQSSILTTHAGPTFPVSGSQAVTQTIGVPHGVSADGAGGFYVSSSTHNKIYRISSDGSLTVIAGTGSPGFSGDGGPATSAQFNYVRGIAVDGAGNLYVADTNNSRIRKVTPGGIITTIVGKGGWGFGGDGGPAASAQLAGPRGVVVDQVGNLYIADSGNNRVRRVNSSGVITTIAGNGNVGAAGDGGPATSAALNNPVAVAIHGSDVFIVDRNNDRVRKVNAAGIITTIAGSAPGFSGDGGPAASARLSDPRGIAIDTIGDIFITDSGNNRIRMINPSGIIDTVVGGVGGFGGDGGPAAQAQLALPVEITFDPQGNLLIADRGNYRVRRVNTQGVIESVAGTNDDGGSALAAQLNFPNAVAADNSGNVYIADTDSQRIRKITPAGVISTVAGNGAAGYGGDGGPASSAQLNYPAGIAVDSHGNLFIADTINNRIRKVTPEGIISTVAGRDSAGFSGDGGSALAAQLYEPHSVAVDNNGNIFIGDTNNHRVRKVNPEGIITTIAGNGAIGFAGDGGPAVNAQITYPSGVAVDHLGNVFIADASNNRIRVVTDGIIRAAAGTGTYGFSGDGGPAVAAQLAYPNNIAVDDFGNLFISDTENQRIRQVRPDGIITTVVGNGKYGSGGDGGPAPFAELAYPYGVAVEGINTLFIADTFDSRIRKTVFNSTAFSTASGGGTSVVTTGNSTSMEVGYAEIATVSGSAAPGGLAIFSYRTGGALISETGVPATPVLTSGRIYAEVNGPVNTGLAIANPNNQSATIHFFFTDTAGNDLGASTTRLEPRQQIARFLDADPFKTFPDGTFQGTLTFTSDLPVGVVALRGMVNERGEFLMSTLPVVGLQAAPQSGTAVVPHFAEGSGWDTHILLINSTDGPLSGQAEFHDDNGQNVRALNYFIAPHASQKISTTETEGTVMTGSVRIVPADAGVAPVPLVVFSYQPGGMVTVSEAGVPATTGTAFRVYVEASGGVGQPGSIQSGIAVTNNAGTATNVTLELSNLDGSTTTLPAPVSQSIPAFGHIARFMGELFPVLPQNFKGILRVSGSTEISVVGLRSRYNERNDFLITTTPPVSETQSNATGELVMPHVADGAGYTTEFIIFSGNGASSGSLLLFQNSGHPSTVTLR